MQMEGGMGIDYPPDRNGDRSWCKLASDAGSTFLVAYQARRVHDGHA